MLLLSASAANAQTAPGSPPAAVGADGPARPGFAIAPDPSGAAAVPQPRRDPPLDPAIAALVVARLVELNALDSVAQGSDPVRVGAALRAFQAGAGLKQTGMLDKKTLAMMAL